MSACTCGTPRDYSRIEEARALVNDVMHDHRLDLSLWDMERLKEADRNLFLIETRCLNCQPLAA